MSDENSWKDTPYHSRTVSIPRSPLKVDRVTPDRSDLASAEEPDGTATLGDARELIFIVRGMLERFWMYQHHEIKLGRFEPIGRQTNELDLTPYGAADRGVTRFHARIHIENNHLFITDMNSTNGTYLGGVKVAVHTPTVLRKGAELMLGRLPIQVMYR
jgi:hypothetical protein